MRTFKPYLDLSSNSDGEVSLSLTCFSDQEIIGELTQLGEIDSTTKNDRFILKLLVNYQKTYSTWKHQPYHQRITLGQVSFSADQPLLEVILLNSEGVRVGSSITHQDDIEDEEMPINR